LKALSVEQIETARVKVLENARELVEEAELLLSNARFARAYALAHLACEEMAKLPMLLRAATDTLMGEEFDWPKLQRRLRSHHAKIRNILFTDYLVDQDVEGDADLKRLSEDLKRVPTYNKLKNWSLYADLSDDVFLKPSELISEGLATAYVKLGRSRLTFFETLELGTQGKIEQIVETPLFKELWKDQ
jgi:AbiV family abortive infection protein